MSKSVNTAKCLTRQYLRQDRGHVTAADVERARRAFHKSIGASLRKVG